MSRTRRPAAAPIAFTLAYRYSNERASMAVLEHPRPVAPNNDGLRPQARFVIRVVENWSTLASRPIGSASMGFEDLDSAVRECSRMNAQGGW